MLSASRRTYAKLYNTQIIPKWHQKGNFQYFISKKHARNVTYLGEKRYTTETIFCAFEYFRLFIVAYNCLKDDFKLPVVCAATQLTSKVKAKDSSLHRKHIFTNLNFKRQERFIISLFYYYRMQFMWKQY